MLLMLPLEMMGIEERNNIAYGLNKGMNHTAVHPLAIVYCGPPQSIGQEPRWLVHHDAAILKSVCGAGVIGK